MITVPFLTRDFIEAEAETLLNGYGLKYESVTKPPVPLTKF